MTLASFGGKGAYQDFVRCVIACSDYFPPSGSVVSSTTAWAWFPRVSACVRRVRRAPRARRAGRGSEGTPGRWGGPGRPEYRGRRARLGGSQKDKTLPLFRISYFFLHFLLHIGVSFPGPVGLDGPRGEKGEPGLKGQKGDAGASGGNFFKKNQLLLTNGLEQNNFP